MHYNIITQSIATAELPWTTDGIQNSQTIAGTRSAGNIMHSKIQ